MYFLYLTNNILATEWKIAELYAKHLFIIFFFHIYRVVYVPVIYRLTYCDIEKYLNLS